MVIVPTDLCFLKMKKEKLVTDAAETALYTQKDRLKVGTEKQQEGA